MVNAMEKIQQEFEEWAIEHHFSTTKKQDGVSYAHDSTMCSFEGWKASRVALCVELPTKINDDNDAHSYGYDSAITDVEMALELSGVPYK